ncbi:MAG: hypothetical protein L6R39_001784 [Caloplaca ligustica]|nr:MAG: hypothetical protein L6R39_001784 [Caloplaca ligustica]
MVSDLTEISQCQITTKRIGRTLASLNPVSGCKTGYLNGDIVSYIQKPDGLGALNVAERLTEGAKIREQAASSQNACLPSHTPDADDHFLSDEYLKLPLEFGLPDLGDVSTFPPAQHEWEPSNSINNSQLSPSSQPSLHGRGVTPQSGWDGSIQPMSSQTMVAGKYPSTLYHPTYVASTGTLSTSTRAGEPINGYWHGDDLPESQWISTGPRHPSSAIPNATCGMIDTPMIVPTSGPRPASAYGIQHRPTPFPQHRCSAGQQPASCDEDSPSPEQRYSNLTHTTKKRTRGSRHGEPNVGSDQPPRHMDPVPGQRRRDSRSYATSPRTDASFNSRTLPPLHTHHSYCHCTSSDSSSDRLTQSNTSSPSPVMRKSPRTSSHTSSDDIDVSPSCSSTLRDIVQRNMPEPNEKRVSVHSSCGPRKSRKYSSTDSNMLEDKFLDDGGGREKGVEKVVIVYLRKGLDA